MDTSIYEFLGTGVGDVIVLRGGGFFDALRCDAMIIGLGWWGGIGWCVFFWEWEASGTGFLGRGIGWFFGWVCGRLGDACFGITLVLNGGVVDWWMEKYGWLVYGDPGFVVEDWGLVTLWTLGLGLSFTLGLFLHQNIWCLSLTTVILGDNGVA